MELKKNENEETFDDAKEKAKRHIMQASDDEIIVLSLFFCKELWCDIGGLKIESKGFQTTYKNMCKRYLYEMPKPDFSFVVDKLVNNSVLSKGENYLYFSRLGFESFAECLVEQEKFSIFKETQHSLTEELTDIMNRFISESTDDALVYLALFHFNWISFNGGTEWQSDYENICNHLKLNDKKEFSAHYQPFKEVGILESNGGAENITPLGKIVVRCRMNDQHIRDIFQTVETMKIETNLLVGR